MASPETVIITNKVFLRYCERIKLERGLSTYKLLKQSGLPLQLIDNLRHNKRYCKSPISLPVYILLYNTFGVPFNLADYSDIISPVDPVLKP